MNNFTFNEISVEELYKVLPRKQLDGYRLTQICATAFEGYNEIIYTVTKDYLLENYKIKLNIDDEIHSFSNIYPAAMLYENEMKELFGVNVTGISLDYNNKFYRIEQETPFKKQVAQKAAPASEPAAEIIANDMSKCILCGLCARKCPEECITVDRTGEKTWTIARDKCVQCGACVDACLKFKALSLVKNDNGEKGVVTLKKEDK